jgi:hypothetical protein
MRTGRTTRLLLVGLIQSINRRPLQGGAVRGEAGGAARFIFGQNRELSDLETTAAILK